MAGIPYNILARRVGSGRTTIMAAVLRFVGVVLANTNTMDDSVVRRRPAYDVDDSVARRRPAYPTKY